MEKQLTTLICIFIVVPFVTWGNSIDSLENVLHTQALTPQEKLKIYDQLSLFYNNNDINKTIEYSQKGLKLAQKDKNYSVMSRFYERLGIADDLVGNDEAALKNYEESINLSIKANDKIQEGNAYTALGAFYGRRGKYYPALEYFMKALSVYEEKGAENKCIVLYCNIGSIYRVIDNPEQAIRHQKKAKALAEKAGHINGQIQSYIELSVLYVDMDKDIDNALEYALKAEELCRTHNHTIFAVSCMEVLSKIYYSKLENYEKAEWYAKEAIRLASGINDSYGIAGGWNMLANVYRKQKLYKQSEEAALKAWQIDSTSQDISTNILYNLAYSNIFTGNKEKAASFLEKYDEFGKEHRTKTHLSALMDLEIKYETEKKELLIDTLEKEKGLYRWLGIAMGVILLLVVGLLFFVRHLGIQKRKIALQQVRQLEQEKQLIATQAVLDTEVAERSHLARELHDGLGGILSVISLNLSNIKNIPSTEIPRLDTAQELLQEATGELRRIAHHILPESLGRDGLKVALEDFCKAIPGTNFHYFGDEAALEKHLEKLLYRCAYELINNAVKHANASHINVQLIKEKGLISLTVQDDGVGFDQENKKFGVGLKNIHTRVAAYKGKMNIYTLPGKGTEVTIEIEST